MTIQLGDLVEDIITGFKGVAVIRIEHLNGCLQFGLESTALEAGKPVYEAFDFQRLTVLEAGKFMPQDHPDLTEVAGEDPPGGRNSRDHRMTPGAEPLEPVWLRRAP